VIDVEPFSLSLARPLETARGPIERRKGFLVRVTVDGQPASGRWRTPDGSPTARD
jgi:hypothetical protein